MRLNSYVAPVIVTGLFVTLALGLRESVHDDWVIEYNRGRMPLPALEADTLAFPGAIGMGRRALTTCRDSVIDGSWDLKVWKVDPATYDELTDSDGGLYSILTDSVADDQFDVVIFVQGGILEFQADAAPAGEKRIVWPRTDCIYVSGAPAQGDGPPIIRSIVSTTATVRLRVGGSGSNFVEDVVVRDLRIWGDSASLGAGEAPFVAIRAGERLVVDHNEWYLGPSNSEIAPAGTGPNEYLNELTVSYNSIGPGHNSGDGETLLQTGMGDDYFAKPTPEDSARAWSFVRNFLAHGVHRMPIISNSYYPSIEPSGDAWIFDEVEHINNIAYDFGQVSRMMELRGAVHIDVVGNQLARGTNRTIGNSFQPIRVYRCSPLSANPTIPDSLEMYPSTIYADDNIYLEQTVQQPEVNRDLFWIPDASPYYYNCSRGGMLAVDSLFTDTRNANADSVTAWPAEYVDDSLFNGSLNVQVGPRKLSCYGDYVNVRDSVLQKLIDYYENGTYLGAARDDSMALGWDWLGRDSLVAGTLCPDLDDDGLPDEYEKRIMGATDSIGLAVDSVSPTSGYFAIEMFLAGMPFTTGDPPGMTTTYGNDRNVYYIDVVHETATLRNAAGASVGSVIRRALNADSIDAGTPYKAMIVSDRDSGLLITYDTMSVPAAGVQDSVDVDDIMLDIGIPVEAGHPATVPIPGDP
jgi:hypothetical protein